MLSAELSKDRARACKGGPAHSSVREPSGRDQGRGRPGVCPRERTTACPKVEEEYMTSHMTVM